MIGANNVIYVSSRYDVMALAPDTLETLWAAPTTRYPRMAAANGRLYVVDGKRIVVFANGRLDDDEKKELDANEVLLNKSLIAMSPVFNDLLAAIKQDVNLLPPSGAMAGIFTMVDNTRGVWKAPANVSVAGVIQPAVNISHDEQDLNVTPQGKSVNAIRSFIGEGTLVWGARTLDGNSLDWRYINVRRMFIMMRRSLDSGMSWVPFEPNDTKTWSSVQGITRTFCRRLFQMGMFAGGNPAEAFYVKCDAETNPADEVAKGYLTCQIGVAPVIPAEFIMIQVTQTMTTEE